MVSNCIHSPGIDYIVVLSLYRCSMSINYYDGSGGAKDARQTSSVVVSEANIASGDMEDKSSE